MTTATKYKTYPKYKPSGIDWLGDIPTGWEVSKLKYLTDAVEDGGTPSRNSPDNFDGEINWLVVDDIEDEILQTSEKITKKGYRESNAKIWQPGDIILSFGATIGEVGIAKVSLTTKQGIAGIKVNKKIHNKFLFYLLKILKEYLNTISVGTTIFEVRPPKLKQILFPLPLIEIQKNICNFLDHETEKIDEMVGKKQKMAELLKEKRQALITQAVTKGLDPKAKMKSSGIDWLGDIPMGWDVKRLKYVTRSNVSSLAENTGNEYLFKYLDIGNVGTGYVLEEPAEVYFDNAPSRARRIVKKHDTIISTVRTYLKAIYHFENDPVDIIVSTGFAVIEVGKTINPKFFYYLSLSEGFIDSIVSNSYGVSYPAINESFLMTLPAWYPKIEEQKEIVEFLDREAAKIDEVMTKIASQIEKLQEYRQALITSAVTGKIVVQYDHGN